MSKNYKACHLQNAKEKTSVHQAKANNKLLTITEQLDMINSQQE